METSIGETTRRLEAWSQIAIVIVTLISIAVYVGGRLAAIEAWENSADMDRAQMIQTINRIESRIDALTDGKR